MKRIARAGIGALGMGVSTFAAVAGMSYLLEGSAEHYRAEVIACAHDLGQVATQATRLPADCRSFEEAFKKTTISATTQRPYSQTSTSNTHVMYELPAAADFSARKLADDAESRQIIAAIQGIALGAGAIFGGVFFGTIPERQPRLPEDEPVTIPAQNE